MTACQIGSRYFKTGTSGAGYVRLRTGIGKKRADLEIGVPREEKRAFGVVLPLLTAGISNLSCPFGKTLLLLTSATGEIHD